MKQPIDQFFLRISFGFSERRKGIYGTIPGAVSVANYSILVAIRIQINNYRAQVCLNGNKIPQKHN
jgi:hypothetical protein